MEVDVVSHSLNLLETLKESIENNKLSDVKDAVEDWPWQESGGPKKSAFINALRGLGPEDDGAALSPCPTPPGEMAIYSNPKHPDFRLWDLPPTPAASPFEPEGYMERVKFLRYNVVVMAFTQSLQANSVAVFLEARSMQKDIEKGLEERRNASLELIKAQGVALPKEFLVRPSCLEKLDFPGLLEEMERDLPEIRAHTLLLALPTLSPVLVTQKRDAFKALVWAAASLSGGVSAIPVPLVASMVDARVGVRILTKARASLCLDDESVERLAWQRCVDPARLKALRTCNLSVEVTKGEVHLRLAAAEKELTTNTTRLVEMAMPRHARSAGRSFTTMLQALNGAIDEMGVDEEKILAAAGIGEGK
ncbi:interferon-inducible GTPase 5-like [Salvelinus alpinus]|uniref:interferon-inducible GTPase 5-like n=1 Tax=Salvelinus alpinus TaxID=8036 RepID=UPI0039FCBECC